MKTGTRETLPNNGVAVNRRTLHVQIERQRDHVLDLELTVDAARETIDRDVEQLRDAVRERDAAVIHLTQLLEWAEDVAA